MKLPVAIPGHSAHRSTGQCGQSEFRVIRSPVEITCSHLLICLLNLKFTEFEALGTTFSFFCGRYLSVHGKDRKARGKTFQFQQGAFPQTLVKGFADGRKRTKTHFGVLSLEHSQTLGKAHPPLAIRKAKHLSIFVQFENMFTRFPCPCVVSSRSCTLHNVARKKTLSTVQEWPHRQQRLHLVGGDG